jgi:GTPase SAR1 family protein
LLIFNFILIYLYLFIYEIKGIVLVYDITCEKSFDNILKWLKTIESDAPKDIKIILLGNKCDLPEYRRISLKKGQEVS